MALLSKIPDGSQLVSMIGKEAYASWLDFCSEIDSLYEMDKIWSDGGKKWDYEYKYRRGGKTLCALYAARNRFGIMFIFGKEEQNKFEEARNTMSAETLAAYDDAAVFYDGKWVMFSERLPLSDLKTLLRIKRKPNKK